MKNFFNHIDIVLKFGLSLRVICKDLFKKIKLKFLFVIQFNYFMKLVKVY